MLIDGRGLVAHPFDSRTERTVEPDVRFGGTTWLSPDESRTALTVKRGNSTHLVILEDDGTFRDLMGIDGDVAYTAVWSPTSDSLLFGFQLPDQRGIAYYDAASGDVTDVGCLMSSLAYSWGRNDWFVVGDESNQYVVERVGCGTIESTDTRKMHEIVFGPKGARAAYVLRQLEYVPASREYRPDSSLYVSTSLGTDPILIAGDRYRPHRPDWSPDGMSLAFDARLPDSPNRRLISVFDLDTRQSSFLNPNAVKSKSSEWAPTWSPSGDAIAYVHSTPGKAASLWVKVLTTSHSAAVGRPGEQFRGWLSRDLLVLSGNGVTRIVRTDGKEILTLGGDAEIVANRTDYPTSSE